MAQKHPSVEPLQRAFTPRAVPAPALAFAHQSQADLHAYYTVLPREKYLMHWDAGEGALVVYANGNNTQAAQKIIAFAERYPAAKPHIVFERGGTRLPYGACVIDLEKDAARYIDEQARRRRQPPSGPLYVLTPPVLGRDADGHYVCRAQQDQMTGRQISVRIHKHGPFSLQPGQQVLMQVEHMHPLCAYGAAAEHTQITLDWIAGKSSVWNHHSAIASPSAPDIG